MLDRLDRRVLGGVRFRDQLSGAGVSAGLELTSRTLRFARTSSGTFAIVAAPGFAEYVRAFKDVPNVPKDTHEFQVRDASRRFLPIAGSIELPRDHRKDANADRVDAPVVLELPTAGGRPATAGWSTVRIRLVDQADKVIRGALIRALKSGTTDEIGWTLTDENGEAHLPIIGIPQLQEAPAPADDGGGGGGGADGDDDDDDADDDTALVSAETRLKIAVAAHKDQPWPANPATLRKGGDRVKKRTFPTEIVLKAGGAVRRQLKMTLT